MIAINISHDNLHSLGCNYGLKTIYGYVLLAALCFHTTRKKKMPHTMLLVKLYCGKW
jgi:hypothetical protein